MAIVSNNDITFGLRGQIGDFFVFRYMRGKTIASRAPRKPDPRKQSAAQRQTRLTFREASGWAVQTLRDPAQKAYYAQRAKELALPNAYTAALQEYMRRKASARMKLTESVSASITPDHIRESIDRSHEELIHAWNVPTSTSYQTYSSRQNDNWVAPLHKYRAPSSALLEFLPTRHKLAQETSSYRLRPGIFPVSYKRSRTDCALPAPATG